MEFRLLGSVEASDRGIPVDLGSPKQRLVLAVLAFAPGRTVPIQVLIDRVWEDASPADVRSSLHSYISRLRKVLSAGSPIARHAAGYALQSDPGDVDVTRFRELVTEGKRLAGAEPPIAVDRLHEAIALWRGRPLADLSGRWVEQIRTALDRQRLDALVCLGELELHGGPHHELVGMLTNWTEEYPLSEPLAGLLMRALLRSGRRAEALAYFAQVREHLVAELGEEPGWDLQRLHERILQRDPALELPDQHPDEALAVEQDFGRGKAYAPAELTSTALHIRPAELPAANPTFVGRFDETGRLSGLLTRASGQAVPVAAIAGAAGTGKSALAVQVAHAVADKFPDGVLFANLHGSTPGRSPADPVDVLAQFLRSHGYPPHQVPAALEDATALFRSATAERRLLVVLDDAVNATQVRPLIPSGAGSAVLLTSRRVLATLDATTHLHLHAMTEHDACDLLTAMASPDQTATRSRSTHALPNVVELCGRLPLAIRIAAARLAAHPEWDLPTLADRLSGARQRLDELQYADLDVRASFAMSTAGLDPALLRTFELLGMLDLDHITVPVAAAAGGDSLRHAHARLDALVEAQLLSTTGRGRHTLHDLIRLYARELAGADLERPQQGEAIKRVHHYFLATIRNAAAILTPATEPRLSVGIPPDQVYAEGSSFGSRADAAQWVDTEAGNLLATARQAASTPTHQSVVVALSAAAAGPLNARGHIRVLTQLARLAIDAAVASHDERGLAQAHNDLAIGYTSADLGAALEHAEHALRAWSQLGDLSYQAATLNNLGILWQRRGDADLALDHFRRALDIRHRLGHTDAQAAILTNMSEAFAERAEFQQAFHHLEQALTLYRSEGALGGQGYALGNLGKVHLKAGNPGRALTCLERAVQLVSQAALRHFEADFRWHLGATHHALGNPEQARIFRRQALDILRQTGTLTDGEAQAILADPSPATPQQLR